MIKRKFDYGNVDSEAERFELMQGELRLEAEAERVKLMRLAVDEAAKKSTPMQVSERGYSEALSGFFNQPYDDRYHDD